MNELISVVVPIYKVENYLKKAINSIINQTYKNIEIILVDDGSPDNCGNICDEYSKKDNRIKVIHKKNGGLSDARNVGVEIAKGEYILFIDSDDWIENNMIEELYKNIKYNNCDISICEFIEEDSNGKIIKSKKYDKEIIVFNNKEALKDLIIQKNITNHAWNKLYKRSLFDDIKYPKGQLMEDISTTYKLFEKSNRIVYQNIPLYHYIQRNTSILGNITEKRINDQEKAIFERNQYLINKYPEMCDILNLDNIENVKVLYYLAIMGNYKKLYKSTKYKQYYKEYKLKYKEYKNSVKKEEQSSMNLFYFNKALYILYVYLKKWIGKVR